MTEYARTHSASPMTGAVGAAGLRSCFENLWFSDQGLIKGCRVMGWGWLVTKIGQEHSGLVENYHSVWFKIFGKKYFCLLWPCWALVAAHRIFTVSVGLPSCSAWTSSSCGTWAQYCGAWA